MRINGGLESGEGKILLFVKLRELFSLKHAPKEEDQLLSQVNYIQFSEVLAPVGCVHQNSCRAGVLFQDGFK
jgi:hypothetical protein